MTETTRLVDYYYIETPDKPGEAVRILDQLRHAGVFLLAFSGFPKGRRAQLDFVPANAPAFKAAARTAGWKTVGPKKCFLVYGEDRIGVVADLLGDAGRGKDQRHRNPGDHGRRRPVRNDSVGESQGRQEGGQSPRSRVGVTRSRASSKHRGGPARSAPAW